MAKIRVHELAKMYGLDNRQVLEALQRAGLDVHMHSSQVAEAEAKGALSTASAHTTAEAYDEEPAPASRQAGSHELPEDAEDWDADDFESFYAVGPSRDDDWESQAPEADFVPPEYEVADVPRPAVPWFFDGSGYHPYLLLNGSDEFCTRLEQHLAAAGIACERRGRSRRPASNGQQYDWYLRLVDNASGKPTRPTEQRVFGALARFGGESRLPARRPAPVEQTPLRIRQLEADLEAAHTAKLRLETELRAQEKALKEEREEKGELFEQLRWWSAQLNKRGAERPETAELQDQARRLTEALEERTRTLQALEDQRASAEAKAARGESAWVEAQTQLEATQHRLTAVEAERDHLVGELRAAPPQPVSESPGWLDGMGDVQLNQLCEHLFPELHLHPRSYSFLCHEAHDPSRALQKLHELNCHRGDLHWEAVEGASGWLEAHFNDGRGDTGRIYYRRKKDRSNRLPVLVSCKRDQKRDIARLKSTPWAGDSER